MAAYREYQTRSRVTRRPARPVELITVTFTNGTARVYDPKGNIFPVSGDTVRTLEGATFSVDSTVAGGANPVAGLERDVGGSPRPRQ